MSYRVAIIGAGTMGREHARQWASIPDAEVVGVLAESGESGWDALLRQTRPDIVDVCVPTAGHREYVERAASAGKAIFVETPLARTLADCDAMAAAVERAGVPCMAGHVARFSPEYAGAKRLVDAGGVGAPAAIRTARLGAMPHGANEPNWYADFGQSGGVALDWMVHDFDWLRWTFGPVERVFAKGRIDYALATLRFESGAIAHVTGSWAHPSGFRATFEIAGDGGIVEYDSAQSAPLTIARKDGMAVNIADCQFAPQDNPYFLQLQAFVQALRESIPPPVTVQDAYEATRIALAALESIETGKVVTLP